MIVLTVITDGRYEYLKQTVTSAAINLGRFDRRFLIDDSGDREYTSQLRRRYPEFTIVAHPERRGLAAAAQTAWHTAAATDATHLFHLEEDFTFSVPISLDAMAACLDRHPCLAQLVLKRQPWSAQEKEAGGQIEVAPDEYIQCLDGTAAWVEHRRLFSFNPTLIPRWVFDRPWGPILERTVTDQLLEDPTTRFAYWGHRDDPPRCEHIGISRSDGYRW